MPDTRILDARYRCLEGAPEADSRVVLLLGTREVVARMVCLGAPEEGNNLVQLRLSEPLPCLAGDHFVIRRESPARTLGGGVVLDPYAQVVRKAGMERASEQLERLEEGDEEAWLERGGPSGLSEAEGRARFGEPRGLRMGDRWFARSILEKHRETLHLTLQRLHSEHPLASGHNRKSLKAGLLKALGDKEYLALLQEELREGRLEEDGARVREPGWKVTLSPAQEQWRIRALEHLEAAGWEGSDSLRTALPMPEMESLIFLLRDRGEAELVGDRLLSGAVLRRLVEKVQQWFQLHPSLDPAAFKDLFGLTRRTAIPLLEWLDQAGVTRRQGDVRVRGRET
jgi:selenocysteine-specific elongation factor